MHFIANDVNSNKIYSFGFAERMGAEFGKNDDAT